MTRLALMLGLVLFVATAAFAATTNDNGPPQATATIVATYGNCDHRTPTAHPGDGAVITIVATEDNSGARLIKSIPIERTVGSDGIVRDDKRRPETGPAKGGHATGATSV